MTVQGDGTGGRSGSVRTAWVGGASNWLLAFGSLVFTAVAIGLQWRSLGPASLALLVLPVAVLLVSRVRVVAGVHGLRIGLGPWGRPSRTIGTEQITSARAEAISAMSVGGWGVRRKGTLTAYLVRGGECLVVTTADGREVAVSCDDAARGAAVLDSGR